MILGRTFLLISRGIDRFISKKKNFWDGSLSLLIRIFWDIGPLSIWEWLTLIIMSGLSPGTMGLGLRRNLNMVL
jgi:hypothetical protein